jgi:hypothetical protein
VIDDGGDGEGSLAMHEPGHEIDAIAAEVIQGAGAVLRGVGKPGEEFGRHADFLGALMAVVDNDAADLAQAAVLDIFIGGAVGGVPGGFVIDQDLDVVLAGDFADGEGVVEGDGQGLLDHDGDAVLGGDLDGGAVLGDGGVDEDGLGLAGFDQVGFAFEEERGGEIVFLLVFGEEGGVGVGDADELDFRMVLEGGEEAFNVAMLESDDGDAEGLGVGGVVGRELGAGGFGGLGGEGGGGEEQGRQDREAVHAGVLPWEFYKQGLRDKGLLIWLRLAGPPLRLGFHP